MEQKMETYGHEFLWAISFYNIYLPIDKYLSRNEGISLWLNKTSYNSFLPKLNLS